MLQDLRGSLWSFWGSGPNELQVATATPGESEEFCGSKFQPRSPEKTPLLRGFSREPCQAKSAQPIQQSRVPRWGFDSGWRGEAAGNPKKSTAAPRKTAPHTIEWPSAQQNTKVPLENEDCSHQLPARIQPVACKKGQILI